MGMKCVQCSTDNDLSDRTRTGGRCKNCNHPFVFEPNAEPNPRLKFTDVFFQNALQNISNTGTIHFTPKQLQYFLDRRLNKSITEDPIVLSIFGVIFTFGAVFISLVNLLLVIPPTIIAALLFAGAWLGFQGRHTPRPELVTLPQVRAWLRRWQVVNNSIPLLLPPLAQFTQPRSMSPDVTAYSFDRAVICDRDEIAQFLIANNFHFENNCAVLSINGYPQDIFSTVMDMLKRNPDLKVYAIHNADTPGVNLMHRLRTDPNWFGDQPIQFFDLGLSPYQVLKGKRFRVIHVQPSQSLSSESQQSLAPKELEWLQAGNAVELESLPPQRLLQVLNSGIARSQMSNDSGGDIFVMTDYSGGSVYTVESFG